MMHLVHSGSHGTALLQHPVLDFIRVGFGILDDILGGSPGIVQNLFAFLLSLSADALPMGCLLYTSGITGCGLL